MIKYMKTTIGLLLYAISFFCYRNKYKWLFGISNEFSDNAKYAFLEVKRMYPQIRCIWITKSFDINRKMKEQGHECYMCWSILGMWHALTGKVYIYTHQVSSDINVWTSCRAIKVNLWHGIGLKNMGYKSQFEKERFLKPSLFKYLNRNNYLLSPCNWMDQHLADCLGMGVHQVVQDMYPRCRHFVHPQIYSDLKLDKDIQAIIEIFNNFNRIYIYMPTWRDSGRDFLTEAGFDFQNLNEILKKNNNLFLLKLHRNTNVSCTGNFSNIIIVPNHLDVYELLPRTNVLITDYSSIYFDYLLLNKNIILFPFDLEKYQASERDLLCDYSNVMKGITAYNFDDLLEIIEKNDIINSDDGLQLLARKIWQRRAPEYFLYSFIAQKIGITL